MRKTLLLFITICMLGTFLATGQTYTWDPEFFDEDQNVTLTISNFNPQNEWGVSDIYLWAWHFDSSGNQINNPTATGNDFGNSPETAKFTNNGDGTYTFDFGKPQDFFNNTGITRIGYLIKSQDGSEQGPDRFQNVGIVTVRITEPSPTNGLVLVNSGDDLTIRAEIDFQSNTTVMGTYKVFLNDVEKASGTCGTPACVAQVTDIQESGTIRFVGTPPGVTETGEASFDVLVVPTVVEEALPSGLEDGINYSSDPTRATLVLSAPDKDFIYVNASWNNYSPAANDLMKRDPSTGKYWLEINNLTPGEDQIFQYFVFDADPPNGSFNFVPVADPFSTIVLDPFDDQFIPESTFPNLPDYPQDQQGVMSVFKTGEAPFNWSVTNFNKPKKEDLIVYEVLIRDFDANQNFQNLIDRIDYFKELNINAIQLMPVMEFRGNLSWGYDTTFHMALDKYYGTPDKFKEFVDVCHQNGIAVILDIALNHAEFPNPMALMWFNADVGRAALNSPYFNEYPQHSFSVFFDFNHQQPLTQAYTKRIIKHWIEEFKIDGFRWDLTKGFTQNCGNGTFDGDFGCTQNYQQDRVDVLRAYADYSWSLDDTHYVIFEHLGSDNEEQQWANYRVNEDKGIMMWGKMTDNYNELTMGQNGNKNISRIGHESHGFSEARLVGYPESHDEERLMYKNITFGNSSNASHNVKDLNVALSRMSALGAISVMVPGPKMIWHFGDLGMDNSIFTCTDGSVNNDGCKLSLKPQPQWTENWLSDALRRQIYDDWARLHALKINEPVFEGDYTITTGSSNFTPRIDVFDTSIPANQLRNVIILSNFGVTATNVNTNFPGGVTDTWYDLMDPTGNTTVSNNTASISIAPGQFRILGNQPSEALSVTDREIESLNIFPNPTENSFKINRIISDLEIFDLTGKMVVSFKGSFSQNHEFDISNIKTGIYMVRVSNNNGQTMTSKLVKL